MVTLTVLRGMDASDLSDPAFELLELSPNPARQLFELVLISLATDKRAGVDDPLPVSGERRGWWADTFAEEHGGTGPEDGIGSKLWLLNRAKPTQANVAKAKEYAEASLGWMVDEGVAAGVEVTAERVVVSGSVVDVQLEVQIARDGDSPIALRFAEFWEGLT